jgi:hypothetical protein
MEPNATMKHIAYGQFSNIMQVRDAYIVGNLKLPLEAASLRALAIPDSGIWSTKRSVEDLTWFSNGQPTDLFVRLVRAYQSNRSEYQDILKTLLNNLYTEVFAYVSREQIDLAHAIASEIASAFSDYEPRNQTIRMAYLFLALAREANMIPDVKKIPHMANGKFAPKSGQVVGLKALSISEEVKTMPDVPQVSSNGSVSLPSDRELFFIKAQSDHLQRLLQQLPLDAEQLKQKRAVWVDILRGNFDVLLQLLEGKEPEK